MQHLGLSSLYLNDDSIRRNVQHLMALGFLEPDRVQLTFAALKQGASAVLQPLYTYFEQQWMANVSIHMWNVYNVDIRTNNDCEGWHNRFNRAVDRHHPNIWHLLRVITEEQSATDVTRMQIAAGRDVVREARV